MKKQSHMNRQYGWFLIVSILISIIIWAAYGLFAEEEPMETVHISVILEDDGNSRWTAFQQGLEWAARAYQVDMSVVPTAGFSGTEEQWELVEQKTEDGTDGILLNPYNADGIRQKLSGFKGNVRILLVENDISRNGDTIPSVSAVGPDYGDVGKALFDEIMEDYQNRAMENDEQDFSETGQIDNLLQGKKVLLLTSNPGKSGAIQAGEKIKELMKEQNIGSWETAVLSSQEDEIAAENREADIIIALDDVSLRIAAEIQASFTGNQHDLYGIGSCSDNVYYLEQGMIRSMIVINYFKMGYESVALLADTIRTNNSEQQRVDIGFQAVRPEEVHTPEIEKLLFPIVQ
ncbi:MAG: substrate-binding domain-containing protein [Lachnospiraceae bacterium]